jgi:hypothetical protein
MNYGNQYAVEAISHGGLCPVRETLRKRLEDRRKAAAEHLQDVEKALKFLDDNPNFEAFHDLLGKTGF